MPSEILRLTYIGGPTALLEIGGLRLLTDPTFDPAGGDYPSGPATLHKLAGPALTSASLGPIDYVLLSHDHHFDNLDRAGRDLLPTTRGVLTTTEGAARLGGNSIGLAPWDTAELPGQSGPALRVTATPARHGPQDHDRGPVIGFAVSRASASPAVYIAGDTVWYEGVAEVAHRVDVRIAILNLGAACVPEVGPFHLTMTAAEAIKAARMFPEAAIVPLHFEGWAHFAEGRSQIEQAFSRAGLAHRLHWPEAGKPIDLNL